MNSLLLKPDIFNWKNFILPKPLHGCIFRFVGEGGIARGGDRRQGKEHDVMEQEECAREEREESARSHGGVHHEEKAGVPAAAENLLFSSRSTKVARFLPWQHFGRSTTGLRAL